MSFARTATVDLNGNQSGLFDLLIVFCVVDSLKVVDPQLDVATFTQNSVRIPVISFQHFREFLFIGRQQNLVAARFVIQRAPIVLAEIRLITNHLMMIRDALTSQLHAGIRVSSDELELQPQLEITVFFRG